MPTSQANLAAPAVAVINPLIGSPNRAKDEPADESTDDDIHRFRYLLTTVNVVYGSYLLSCLLACQFNQGGSALLPT